MARGSSPPPIPADARAHIAPADASTGQDDDTEHEPFPHAALRGDEEAIASESSRWNEDPTAILDQASEAAAASSTGHPVIDIAIPAQRPGRRSRIRRRTALPRSGGLTGDLRYVFAAIRGVAQARRGLAHARGELERERAARDGELIAFARRAVAALDLDLEAVSEARDALSQLEEKRAHRAGRVAAAEESLAAIERQRAAELDELRGRRRRLDAKLASVRERLGPLSRRGSAALRRAGELEAAARGADKRVAFEERKLFWIRGPRLAGLVEAGLRDRRAELEAIEHEQLEVAAELDDVEPAIASLQSSRADLCAKLEALDREEEELDVRAAERLEAVRAARRVDERAAAEADRERDIKLRELAERLAVDRPPELVAELGRLDERELAIATHERRVFEYSELIAGLDRRALVRGTLLMACIATAAVASLVLFL